MADDNVALAWAAGLIDGDGCIGISKHKGTKNPIFTPRLSVEMTDKSTLVALKSILRRGKIVGPKLRNGRSKPVYRYTVWSNEALECMKLLYPYLITKVGHACLLVEVYAKLPPRVSFKEKEDLYLKFKQLNHRGK